MTEWGVVGVIVVLTGLVATLVRPMLKLNTSITELTVTIRNMGRDISNLDDDLSRAVQQNSESHARIWQHNEDQDARLNEHDKRIHLLEREHEHE